jgi:hypothetical protein
MAMSHDQLVKSRLRGFAVMLDLEAGIYDHFPLVINLVARH